MALSLRLRKFVLTTHITSSVGWLGAVAVVLALAVAGLLSEDAETVRGGYLAMEPITWFILVPLSFASLLTGLVQSLGATWGLFRHYWVLAKLVINIFANVILLMYTQTISYIADVAAETTSSSAALRALAFSPLLHAGGALLLLLVATVLSVYKPRGLTRYGWRKQREERTAAAP
ncbi:MAG: DUF2269 domain-containing protein [Actinomycetota bacterium]